jgi:hypothetical protein
MAETHWYTLDALKDDIEILKHHVVRLQCVMEDTHARLVTTLVVLGTLTLAVQMVLFVLYVWR